MEPSGDGLCTEEEMETGEMGRLRAEGENAAQPETSEGPAGRGESVPGSSAGEPLPAVEGPTGDAPDAVPAAPLQPPTPGSKAPEETRPPEPPRPSRASLAETDCLICFHPYSPQRPPKLLACQHAFCAVCLKLLLRREDRAWCISCPLCRKATLVFGGLVCSLHDREGLGEQLPGPGPGAEGPCPAAGAGPPHGTTAGPDEADAGANRAAAKRLLLLLVLAAMLILLVLPFLYTGLLKWALCSVVALGLLLSVVLSCDPGWSGAHRPWPPWRSKEGQGASAA